MLNELETGVILEGRPWTDGFLVSMPCLTQPTTYLNPVGLRYTKKTGARHETTSYQIWIREKIQPDEEQQTFLIFTMLPAHNTLH